MPVAAPARRAASSVDADGPLFGEDLNPAARRFAVAETLSHLERLVRAGAASRADDGRVVSYTQS